MSFEFFTSSKVTSPYKFPVATHALLAQVFSSVKITAILAWPVLFQVLFSLIPRFLSGNSHSKHRGLQVSSCTTNTDQMQISMGSSDLHLPPISIIFWWHWVNLAIFSPPPWQYCCLRTTPLVSVPVSWNCRTILWEYPVPQASKSSAILNNRYEICFSAAPQQMEYKITHCSLEEIRSALNKPCFAYFDWKQQLICPLLLFKWKTELHHVPGYRSHLWIFGKLRSRGIISLVSVETIVKRKGS